MRRMLNLFQQRWGMAGVARVLAAALAFMNAQTDGELLRLYLEGGDISVRSSADVMVLLLGGTRTTSARSWAEPRSANHCVYIHLWEKLEVSTMLRVWRQVHVQSLSEIGHELLGNFDAMPEEDRRTLPYVGLTTLAIVEQRINGLGYADHQLMHALWQAYPPTTHVVFGSSQPAVLELMEFVIAELAGTYAWFPFGRCFNRQPGGPYNAARQWRPYTEAQEFVAALGLRSHLEWKEWGKSSDRPLDIPAAPSRVYAAVGWVGWSRWLGYK